MKILLSALSTVTCMALSPSASGQTLGEFQSVIPAPQSQALVLPNTHTFQILLTEGMPLVDGSAMLGSNDFTAYIPINGSSTDGYLGLNHEAVPGGVSMHTLEFNEDAKRWNVLLSRPVDFTPVVRTRKNCSGGISPWGTFLSAEEFPDLVDQNSDGLNDVGWIVEIDPVTASVVDHDGDGLPEKLHQLGYFSHENIAVSDDRVTAYMGEDDYRGYVFRFIADQPDDLSTGTLYVLKLDSAWEHGNWVVVPNQHPIDQNNTSALAESLGATSFKNVEDIEIGPDGYQYFGSKISGNLYRFRDDGDSIPHFEVHVRSQPYAINTGSSVVMEPWGIGIDNLVFDNEGNLWVCQDGDHNHIWVVRPDHSMSSPHIDLFARTPLGSEPTGMTFSPDNKFMFMSLQHPWSGNTFLQFDATGTKVSFNRSTTVVISLNDWLGTIEPEVSSTDLILPMANPVVDQLDLQFIDADHFNVQITVHDLAGRFMMGRMDQYLPAASLINLPVRHLPRGIYLLTIIADGKQQVVRFVR